MNKKVEAWLEDASPDSEVYQCALEYKKLETALDSISEIGVSDRLDICQAMLRGVMETAKSVLASQGSEETKP